MEKQCKKCKESKLLDEFGLHATNRDGYNGSCKICIKKTDNERKKKYYENNKESIIIRTKKYNKLNKDKVYQYQKNYIKQYKLINLEILKDKARIYRKNRMDNEPLFKLKNKIRSIIHKTFVNSGFTKKNKSFDILGCTIEEFKQHLESKFEDWMSWDNRGLYNGTLNFGWDIDHIIPLSSATTESEIIKLNHYTNLQPLCSYTNRYIKKGNVN